MKNVECFFGPVLSGKDEWIKYNLEYGDLIETVSFGVLSVEAIRENRVEFGPYVIYFNEIVAIYRKQGFDYHCIWKR